MSVEKEKFEKVMVLGAGGVGFWMVVALARDLPQVEVEVWDDDTFEGGAGARRLPFVDRVGMKKVDFLEGFLMMTMGDGTKVKGVGKRWTGMGDERLERVLVVDATDMELSARKEMWGRLKEKGAEVWRVSYDGNGVVAVAPGLPLIGKPGGGYGMVPTLAQSLTAGGLGAQVVRRLWMGEEVEEFEVSV